ncbi:MAG: class I adenylate-forming enzyme family protein [Desulfobacteria bacterium]
MQLIRDMFDMTVKAYPKKDAIVFNDTHVTYDELNESVSRLANGLRKVGVGKNDLVMVHLKNNPDIVTTYYAIIKLGAIVVPLNVMYVAHEIRYVGTDTGAKAIIVDCDSVDIIQGIKSDLPLLESVIVVGDRIPEGAIRFRDLISGSAPDFFPADCDLDDITSIIYTSGTTGRPKGATQTHRSILSNVSSFCNVNKLNVDDKLLCALPLYNNFAINVVMMSCIYAGATMVLVDRFDGEKVLQRITRHRATYFAGTPTMFIYLLHAYDPSRHSAKSLRVVNCGGAHCSLKVIEDVEKTFDVVFLNGYGQTEGCGFTTLNPIVGVRKPESVGVPLSNVWVRIVDDEDSELPSGKVGEITEKGDVFSIHGYWKRPEVNAEYYKNGWFYSGDLGYVDEDGYLYVVDRKQDLIITGGANIYPVEIEDILYTHPAVALVAVIGIPDEIKGELAKAYIVKKKGADVTDKEVINYVRDKIAKYKAPRLVEFVDSLPQGPTGKILKKELRAKLARMK